MTRRFGCTRKDSTRKLRRDRRCASARDFVSRQSSRAQECFVHFKPANCGIGAKNPAKHIGVRAGGSALQKRRAPAGSQSAGARSYWQISRRGSASGLNCRSQERDIYCNHRLLPKRRQIQTKSAQPSTQPHGYTPPMRDTRSTPVTAWVQGSARQI